MDFDYFYNREAERFNFLKVPEILVDGEEFKGLSAEAIILYSMLLKRTGMSFKNNWIDKEGRVFIYFTVEEIMKRRNISKPTAIKTLDELDVKKGIGLIERVKLGLGKPNIIYVKDFMSVFQVKEHDFQKSKNLISEVKDFNLRSKENELHEVQNVDSNYIENNKSKYSKREYSFAENGLGKIPVKHFDRLFNTYDTEQQDLEKQIQYFEQEIESYHQRKVYTDKFLKIIEKYTDIEELTVPMINEYIEKVVVHEATGGRQGKNRKQQVDVYFNFIGNCQVPQKADMEKMT